MPAGPAPVTPANDASGGQPTLGSSRVTIINKPDPYESSIAAGLQWPTFSPASFQVVKLTVNATLELNPPLVVRCDCTSGNITVTLPSAAATDSHIWHISKVDSSANTVTVAMASGDTWYGATASQTLATQWKSVTLVSVNDPINTILGWHVIATT